MTPKEIFRHHVAALLAGDFGARETHDAEDALVLMAEGGLRGRAAIRALFGRRAQALRRPALEARATAFADTMLLLMWTADSALNTVPDGVHA